MLRNRFLPTIIIALVGAVVGSFVMMLYASTHFANVAGPGNTPPAVSAAPLTTSGGSDQERIINAVKRTKPAVVSISITVNGKQYVPADPFLQQFGAGGGSYRPFRGSGSGSGFVFDSKGDIVTNAHVAHPDIPGGQVSNMTVTFPNGKHSPAHLIAANIGADLAVIRVTDTSNLPAPLSLGDSDKAQQGQWAIAIGEPYELQQSVTVGVVSAFNRSEPIQSASGQTYTFKGLLQTSAPINPGNSGGPLIDMNGDVIGVNQSTLRGGAEGIGFAIPSNTVRKVVAQMIAHPGITTPPAQAFLGVVLGSVTQGFRSQANYHGEGGVAVYQVESGSPADQAGINPGDVILQLNGKSYSDNASLVAAIAKLHAGDKATLEVWSQASGARHLVTITLGARPSDQSGLVPPDQQQGPPDNTGP